MGRYKRHSKTKTIKQHNAEITYSTVSYEKVKRPKAYLSTQLISDFTKAVKKNNRFRDMMVMYEPFDDAFEDSSVLPSKIFGGRVKFDIGDKIKYAGCVELYNRQYYHNLFGKICLLNVLLRKKDIPTSSHYNIIGKPTLLEYYAKEEVKNKNIKVYPNNLVFAAIFGSIFAIIGFISLLVMLYFLFGFFGSAIYAIFVTIVLFYEHF